VNLPLEASNILPQAANEADQLLVLEEYNFKRITMYQDEINMDFKRLT